MKVRCCSEQWIIGFFLGAARAWTHVPRVSKHDFDPRTHYFHNNGPLGHHDYPETPVLIENALDLSECETMCNYLQSLTQLSVNVQRKQTSFTSDNGNEEPQSSLYSCTFQQALVAIMGSRHEDACLVFEEGLLDRHASLETMKERIHQIQKDVFAQTQDSSKYDDEDWLQHFPVDIRPTQCVVMAGEGATSTLHRDPLEWTGTSICLEGTKVWRFLAPEPDVTTVDQRLASYRLESIAWGRDDDENDDSVVLSAGWQSECSLYKERAKDIPSAQEFDEMEDTEKWNVMEQVAHDLSKLRPSVNGVSNIWSVVQRPGDLLIIPAYWWHQTYALEPSIAVASQRCGTYRDAPRLVQHVLETSGFMHDTELVSKVLKESYEEDSPGAAREVIRDLLTALRHQ